ncbi:MAG: hypothetical protein GC149_20220 [Gammaproteobacteria bacterium]|nr:hypothetical protein [Gammaproteobacteria bacterium]
MQKVSMTNRLYIPFGLAVTWLLLIGLFILQLWTELPKTSPEWLFLVVAGPLAYLAGESFFAWLFSDTRGKAISTKPFSWLRVAVMLAFVTGFIGLSALVTTLLTN